MLKIGVRSSVVKAVLKMKNICNRKLARPSFCWACFLVVVIVGRKEEYSLQIMWWVGNAELSSVWKHYFDKLSCDSLFICASQNELLKAFFFLIYIHSSEINLCIGFLLIGICLLCGHSRLDFNSFQYLIHIILYFVEQDIGIWTN